jgi:hypothetical protein
MASTTMCAASMIAPTPMVMTCRGTSAGLPKKRALSAMVCGVSVFSRVRELREELGSLKPMCPSEPRPSSCKSIPPERRMASSYSAQWVGISCAIPLGTKARGMQIDVGEKILLHEGAVGLRVRARQPHVFIQIEGRGVREIERSGAVALDQFTIEAQRRGARGEAEHARRFRGELPFENARGFLARGRGIGLDDDFHRFSYGASAI